MRFLFAGILALHAFIHLIGFTQAFHISKPAMLSREISRPAGLLWLLATLLLLTAAILFLARTEQWWMPALAGMLLSQVLIFTVWKDARFGSIANLIILVMVVVAAASWNFVRQYRNDARAAWQYSNVQPDSLLTLQDLQHLPPPVQRYLQYTGCVGKPKVHHMQLWFEGQLREKGQDFFPFRAVQFSAFDQPTRLFFLDARVKGLPTQGYHRYLNTQASMDIKLLSLYPVVNISEGALNQAETVTMFNDMCLLAPATLVDRRIQWEPVDDLSAKALFTNKEITISALLYFNAEGQLVNFVSDDRYAREDGGLKKYRFSTPISEYRNFDGYRIGTRGSAIYHYPEGAFEYGKFHVIDILYNAPLQKTPANEPGSFKALE